MPLRVTGFGWIRADWFRPSGIVKPPGLQRRLGPKAATIGWPRFAEAAVLTHRLSMAYMGLKLDPLHFGAVCADGSNQLEPRAVDLPVTLAVSPKCPDMT